jgi:pectinesterase
MYRHVLSGILALLGLGVVAPAEAEVALPPDITVAADGSGDFRTVQEALNSIPRDNKQRMIVLIKDGVYRGQVRVASPFVTLRGQSRKGTRLEFGNGAAAVLTINASDVVVENLSVINTVGEIGPHEVAVSGRNCDRTVLIDCDVLSQGADTIALWQGDVGRYYHARLYVTGAADFICPRGWCYMTDSVVYEVKSGSAGMWHDGSKNSDQKFVMRNCKFDGVDGWRLARHHHDAAIFFLDCAFSKNVSDVKPYRVIYPLSSGAATEADKARNANLDKTNIWGDRVYFHNAQKDGGSFPWMRNNLERAAGSPRPEQITARWTFAGTWDPENAVGPTVTLVTWRDGQVQVKFSEGVTVKGKPRLVLAGDVPAAYEKGSGSDTLIFSPEARREVPAKSIDLNGGAILATQASATTRSANLAMRGKPD